jgi:hypothetical protein
MAQETKVKHHSGRVQSSRHAVPSKFKVEEFFAHCTIQLHTLKCIEAMVDANPKQLT